MNDVAGETGEKGDPTSMPPRDVHADPSIEDEIRLRAYYRFLARGPDEGTDVDDWLRAADELRAGLERERGQNPR